MSQKTNPHRPFGLAYPNIDTEICPDCRSRLSDTTKLHCLFDIFGLYSAWQRQRHGCRVRGDRVVFLFTCNIDRVTSVRHPPASLSMAGSGWHRGKRFLELFSLFASIILIFTTVRHTCFLLASKMKISPYSQELLKPKTLISRLSGMQSFSSNFFHTISLVLSYFAFGSYTNVNCFLRFPDSVPFLPLLVGFGFSQ